MGERLFRMVKLKDSALVQYVGVYVLRWQSEWGEPQVGFVEVDEPDDRDLSPLPDEEREE